MDSIIEAFVAAGYFRARIRSLSDFDKIVGGIAWAMQIFSYDVDIDIFYADSLDLGQKISLTERIVMVLMVMDCPNPIEPHQIVGLDYVSLLPVIRWLIKRSVEVRREHEAFNRLLALRHFHRVTNTLPARTTWCHVIPVEHLRRIRARTSGSVGDKKATDKSDSFDTTQSLLERLNKDFKLNQQVSFVKLPSLFKGGHGQKASLVVSDESESETSASADQDDFSVDLSVSCGETGQRVEGVEVQTDEGGESRFGDSDEARKELDVELLATSQKIVSLLKRIDSNPSELEVSQYEKRYIELQQQLISKGKELKKLYILFNTLDSTKHYLTKEINLLDSVSDNLSHTKNSLVNRDQFMQQLFNILSQIQKVRDDLVRRLAKERQRCETLSAEHSALQYWQTQPTHPDD